MHTSSKHAARLAAGGLMALLVATPASAALDKCQAAIEKNAQKLQSSILKAFTKCTDGYQKTLVKGDPLSAAGAACQGQLPKVTDVANPSSAIAKTKVALDALITKLTCSDTELITLGHMPTGIFGDRWARLVLLGALKGAYATENGAVAAFPTAIGEMADNGCGECAKLVTPPCQTHACVLGAGTGATTTVLGLPLPVALSGVQLFDFCEFPGVLSNEIAVLGTSPARNFKPAALATNTICSSTLRTASVINCAGGTVPTVSVSTCQDSDLSDGNECPAASATTFCQPDADATTGGSCVTLTAAAPAAGQSFTIATTSLRISTAVGGDLVPCTPDDTYVDAKPATVPVTTATAQAQVLDYGNANGNTQSAGPVTGVPAPSCAQLRSSNISSGTLVTAFPNADIVGSPLGDTVTALSLVCS